MVRPHLLVAILAVAAVIVSFATVAKLTPGSRDPAVRPADPGAVGSAQLAPLAERLEAKLAQDPDDAQAWKALGLVRERLGQQQAALAAYLEAARLAPSDREVTFALRRLAPAQSAN